MSYHTKELKRKTVVITGISSGIGRGSAIRLAELGANVVGVARREDALQELQLEIEKKGGKIWTLTGDISDPETLQHLLEKALKEHGQIDIWINNVGIGALGYFWEIPIDDHARVIDVNLKGLVYGAHVAMQHFIEKGKGILINIGSIDSEVPLALQNTYAATKAAVLSLGRSLTEELKLEGKNKNIQVSTLMPWAVDTPWWNHAANYTGHQPRMAAMDDPQLVIDEVIKACVNPQEKIPVGYKAKGSYLFHRIFPGWAEQFSGKIAEKESEKATPAPPTTGSIYEPMKKGTSVEGNIRERMDKEDKKDL